MIGDPPSLAALAANVLRELIITGELGPGERLIEARLTEQLGVSRPPLREAFAVLAQERLVELEPLGEARDEIRWHLAGDVDPQQLPLGRSLREGVVELEHLIRSIRVEPTGADVGAAAGVTVAHRAPLCAPPDTRTHPAAMPPGARRAL